MAGIILQLLRFKASDDGCSSRAAGWLSLWTSCSWRVSLAAWLGSGQIEFPEFVEMMRDRFGALEYREMCIKDAFQTLDKDKNGYITYDELRAAMLEKGEPLDEKEFQKVIDQLDVNHDGKIEYEEPSRKMCSMSD